MLTKRQLEILQHALGLDEYGRGAAYRNHYCAGGDDIPDCAELVAIGYMRSWRQEMLPYFNCWVTDKGKVAVSQESPAPPKLTRSQERYLAFLNADLGCSFGEYLKHYCGCGRGRDGWKARGSAEPLLGPIDASDALRLRCTRCGERYRVAGDCSMDGCQGGRGECDTAVLYQVVVGGESGHGARPMHPDWVRSLRDQCISASVPFFFKQWGGVRKKATGRILDGREWSEVPNGPAC